jgi:hypothetical protein
VLQTMCAELLPLPCHACGRIFQFGQGVALFRPF